MVVRTDDALQRLGEMAALPPDLSPLRLGTRGEWQKNAFELIGRLRLEYDGGSWNEWFAQFANGQTGWIAETQGFFMITTEAEAGDLPDHPGALKAGGQLRIQRHNYTVVDVKKITVIAAEGELPEVSPPGSQRINSDLTGAGKSCGTIEFHEEGPELYLGSTAEFEELALRELRPVPGWSADVPVEQRGTTALNCPPCGAVVELRATGLTQAAVCGSCGTIIDTANPTLVTLQEGVEAVRKMQPLIPIGTRGELFSDPWEVIGLQNRQDQYASWSEYLLFNPWRGFRWLTTWGGHWNFVSRAAETPSHSGPKHIYYRGEPYALFARGQAVVTGVLGEFYWKVKRGETAEYQDYVRPPEIFSRELYPELQEQAYSAGTYLEPKLVQEAFKVANLPRRTGIFANQPNPWSRRLRGLLPWWILALVLACGIEFLSVARQRQYPWQGSFTYQRPALAGQGSISPAQPLERSTNAVTTPRFKLTGTPQPLEISIHAPVRNSWIGFDATLVNTATEQVYPAELEVSYYEGTDSDGRWTEGSTSASVKIAEVTAGEYYLELEPQADPALAEITYSVALESGGVFWSNFILGLLALSFYPGFVWWRRSAWETARWAESDFTP